MLDVGSLNALAYPSSLGNYTGVTTTSALSAVRALRQLLPIMYYKSAHAAAYILKELCNTNTFLEARPPSSEDPSA